MWPELVGFFSFFLSFFLSFFPQCKSKKIYSGNTIEGLNLILKRLADWICQACLVCWLDLSNMPWGLIGSVKHAVFAEWICQVCHVGWLDLSHMPCGLIESVRHAIWADWICQTCHVGLLDLSVILCGLIGSVSTAVLADSLCFLSLLTVSVCMIPGFITNYKKIIFNSMLYPTILMMVICAVRMKPGMCKLRPSAGIGCPNKSTRFKVCAIVILLGWQHWKFNICHFCS